MSEVRFCTCVLVDTAVGLPRLSDAVNVLTVFSKELPSRHKQAFALLYG